MKMRIDTWNMRSLWGSGLLRSMTMTSELAIFKKWDKGKDVDRLDLALDRHK